MSKSQKQMEKEQERNRKIIDMAFQVFVKRKIEGVSMAEIAEAAGVGRATLFRCYPSKMELVIAVCSVKWKEYLDNLDAARPISGLQDIPAIDRLTFSLDCYVDMYRNHRNCCNIMTILITMSPTKNIKRSSLPDSITPYIRRIPVSI